MAQPHLDLEVDAVETMRQVTVTVEIRRVREAMARLWVAQRLMRLAVWIGNFGLEEDSLIGVIVKDRGPNPPAAPRLEE